MEREVIITEKDVIDTLHIFTKVPSFLLSRWVSKNSNLVKSFEGQIISYKNGLSVEDLAKVEKVLEMPVNELQEILGTAYRQTGKKQLKILAHPEAEPFISGNLKELKRVLQDN